MTCFIFLVVSFRVFAFFVSTSLFLIICVCESLASPNQPITFLINRQCCKLWYSNGTGVKGNTIYHFYFFTYCWINKMHNMWLSIKCFTSVILCNLNAWEPKGNNEPEQTLILSLSLSSLSRHIIPSQTLRGIWNLSTPPLSVNSHSLTFTSRQLSTQPLKIYTSW